MERLILSTPYKRRPRVLVAVVWRPRVLVAVVVVVVPVVMVVVLTAGPITVMMVLVAVRGWALGGRGAAPVHRLGNRLRYRLRRGESIVDEVAHHVQPRQLTLARAAVLQACVPGGRGWQ